MAVFCWVLRFYTQRNEPRHVGEYREGFAVCEAATGLIRTFVRRNLVRHQDEDVASRGMAIRQTTPH